MRIAVGLALVVVVSRIEKLVRVLFWLFGRIERMDYQLQAQSDP